MSQPTATPRSMVVIADPICHARRRAQQRQRVLHAAEALTRLTNSACNIVREPDAFIRAYGKVAAPIDRDLDRALAALVEAALAMEVE